MTNSPKPNDPGLRGAFIGLAIFGAAILLPLAFTLLSEIAARREQIEATTQAHCEDPKDCGRESLHADIRAAVAAEDMVDLAVWQLGLSVVGLVFIGLTLSATLAAVREANDASNAARKAVELTEDHGSRQLRAYITVELGSLKPLEAKKVPKAAVLVTNGGQTPAFNVSTHYVIELLAGGENITAISRDMVPRKQLIIGSKFDKQSTQDAPFALTEAGLQALKDNDAAVVISGCTVYEDTFGKTWWTQFCHYYQGPELSGRYHHGLNKGT